MATRQRSFFLKRRTAQTGFALPTVLIASVVMLTVLAVTVSATSSIRVSLKEQYYSQLAQAAGDAGVAYAKACLAANGNVPTWSNANPLRPNTNCSGTAVGGYPSTVSSNGDVVSTFSVGLPTTDSNGKAVTIPQNGYVQLLRSSTGEVWKTYTQPSAQAAVVPDLCSGSATSILGWNNAAVTTTDITTSGVAGVDAIAINSANDAYPGPHYFRKDFSLTSSGTYEVKADAGATFSIWIDGEEIISDSVGITTTVTVGLDAGCHTIVVEVFNGAMTASGSEIVVSLKRTGSSNLIVKSDSSWRVSSGNEVPYSDPNYYMMSAWTRVRDLNAASAYSASWSGSSLDPFARFIATNHSFSGTNYPFAQYSYYRDSKNVVVSSPTQIKLTSLCDDACVVYLDGQEVQNTTWSSVDSSFITLTEGVHQFAVRLYNGGAATNASGFAISVVRTSDNTVLTRSDSYWLSSNAWTAAANNYYSYDKSFQPTPYDINPTPTAEVLVVGGGGGGGRNGGGGGGAGGVIYNPEYALSVGNNTITIGTGGAAATANTVPGTNGTNTTFGSLVAIGGGGGASRDGGVGGQVGGSGGGGGGATASPRHLGGAGTTDQGSSGGNGTTPDPGCPAAGGGGGGAGGYGLTGTTSQGANGGAGFITYILGTVNSYAGGGAGAPTCPGSYGSATNGGGAGNGVSGTANTGGGGAGNYATSGNTGGSGVVIIKILTGSVTVTTSGSPSVTTDGNYTIYRYTANGSFNVTAIN